MRCSYMFFHKPAGGNMIRFSHTFNKGRVFVKCSENAEEEKELNTLAQEVNMICGMTKKTHLWIVAEFQVGLRKVVVTSLEEKVAVNDNDLVTLGSKVIERLTHQGD